MQIWSKSNFGYCQFHVLAIFSNWRWRPSWHAEFQEKKMKWLHARNIMTKSWYKCIQFFFVSHLAFFGDISHLHCFIFIEFLNNSIQESFWRKFGRNPFSGYSDIANFMFCAILVTEDGGQLGMVNCDMRAMRLRNSCKSYYNPNLVKFHWDSLRFTFCFSK